jgi:hypothetical protein
MKELESNCSRRNIRVEKSSASYLEEAEGMQGFKVSSMQSGS